MKHRQIRASRGFTLIELLVVMTIIGILMSLALPGVTSVMETARKTRCANNLNQFGKAAISHAANHGHFPTGGWGWNWVGDPERGYGQKQPGSWVYNLLPFMDQEVLHDLGKGETAAEKKKRALEVIQTPLTFAHCPSRRRSQLYPIAAWPVNCEGKGDLKAAKTDYAMCTGDQNANEWQGGPGSLSAGDGNYGWPAASSYSGICFIRSEIRPSDVRDGPATTIMLGEKYLDPDDYFEIKTADNETMYSGFDNDNGRTTYYVPAQDQPGYYHTLYFGSVHLGSCNFVFCDGHAKAIAYNVDKNVFILLGNRADDKVIDLTAF